MQMLKIIYFLSKRPSLELCFPSGVSQTCNLCVWKTAHSFLRYLRGRSHPQRSLLLSV